MTKLSVVEAATLSGRAPAEIRALIQQGRLAAEPVALPTGTGYLIDTSALIALGVDPAAATSAAGPGRLRAALANLRAALARRQGGPTAAEDEDEAEPSAPPRPSPRLVAGRSQADLDALAGQVERLLEP